MNIIGIIPARYQSSRLPGKPLADICGKPMIWWTYQRAKGVKGFSEVYVALDDERVAEVCKKYNIPYIETSPDNKTHMNRLHEVSNKLQADLYAVICGDEPLIKPEVIQTIIPSSEIDLSVPVARALRRKFTDPAEVIDPNNIKIVTNDNEECLYLSRSPIPFPFKTVLFDYYKIVGIECYNKLALDFFVNTEPGRLEKIEDIAILRFPENNIKMVFTLVETNALSVDTEKDLEKVRKIIAEEMKNE